VTEISIEIGGIAEAFKNIGKRGIYRYIFGLLDIFIILYFKWDLQS
jgi:hypothetical protein